MTRYKCHACHTFWDWDQEGEPTQCLSCGAKEGFTRMCENDGECHCAYDTKAGMAYCEKCGEPVCPDCGSHDVVQISRVTGYLQEVSGFNRGKQQEVKDRKRYDV